ncbi:MAG: hypothetical protein IT385_15805 [Deltaproteobacteria bacterium]|nr:hypothetical protein [Deltaproteobacteria bacterium]
MALRLDGIVDEHNALSHWLAQVGDGDVLLVDMGGVKRLNSVGVRDWVLWLRALRPKWRTIVLFDCPPAVMNEVNFVRNFAEGAHITTFQVPLFCTRCQKEESRLVDALDLKRRGGALPPFRCERADCLNALDDDEESYLAFLAELPAVPDPERLSRLTATARDVLRPEGAGSVPLDPMNNASAARGGALSQVGLVGQPVARPASVLMPAPALAAASHPGSAASHPGSAARDAASAGRDAASHAGSAARDAASHAGSAASHAPAAPASAVPGSSPAATDEAPGKAGGDWVFIGAITAMVAVLAVLIYLLMTLE